MKLRKGNVFTSMCQEFCPQGGVHPPGRPPQADTPLRQTSPSGRCPPLADTPLGQTPPSGRHPGLTPLPGQTPPPRQAAIAADGTHPTRMHSCYNLEPHNTFTICYLAFSVKFLKYFSRGSVVCEHLSVTVNQNDDTKLE